MPYVDTLAINAVCCYVSDKCRMLAAVACDPGAGPGLASRLPASRPVGRRGGRADPSRRVGRIGHEAPVENRPAVDGGMANTVTGSSGRGGGYRSERVRTNPCAVKTRT